MDRKEVAFIRQIEETYGSQIEIAALPKVLNDLLDEIRLEYVQGLIDPGSVAAYNKTYTEGYNKVDYTKAEYSRYDRTVDLGDYEEILHNFDRIRPELDRFILERIKRPLEH